MSAGPGRRCLEDEAATAALAARLAAAWLPGDVVTLTGPLGAGKTAFARHLIQASGVPDEVPSPTFNLMLDYESPRGPIRHFDLFRLASADEAYELGIEEAFAEALVLIEWPDRIAGLLPDERLDRLVPIYECPKKVPTHVEFFDIAGLVRGASKGEGLGNRFLSHIREVDAIVEVARAFEQQDVTHVDGELDPPAVSRALQRDLGLGGERIGDAAEPHATIVCSRAVLQASVGAQAKIAGDERDGGVGGGLASLEIDRQPYFAGLAGLNSSQLGNGDGGVRR